MRIRIDVPADDVRRERIEHATFARLDAIRAASEAPAGDARRDRVEQGVFAQLSAIRGLEQSDRLVQPRRRAWLPAIAIGAPLAAIGVLAIVISRGGGGPTAREPAITQHVVPPHGGPSQWASGDAVVQAFDDTSVEERIDGDGVTLTLARGKVDCDVEPRAGRAPFRVVAGDVTVTVVGTRFAVVRTPTGVRVDVARGKVSVRRGGDEEKFLLPGDAWSSESVITATAAPTAQPAPPAQPEIEVAPESARPAKPAISSKDAFGQARKLELTKAPDAARLYRVAAGGRDPTYAALALYYLAELERRRGGNAIAIANEYLKRFPRGANVEELLWLRVEAYSIRKQAEPTRKAAEDYLQRFPNGTYASPAREVLKR